MRRGRGWAAVWLASAMLASAMMAGPGMASAQDDVAPPVDEDLRCAIWAGALLNLAEDADARAALTGAFSYFAGRFEGRGGKTVDHAMTAALIERETRDLAALSRLCEPRMLSLADRLDNFAASLASEARSSPEPR